MGTGHKLPLEVMCVCSKFSADLLLRAASLRIEIGVPVACVIWEHSVAAAGQQLLVLLRCHGTLYQMGHSSTICLRTSEDPFTKIELA